MKYTKNKKKPKKFHSLEHSYKLALLRTPINSVGPLRGSGIVRLAPYSSTTSRTVYLAKLPMERDFDLLKKISGPLMRGPGIHYGLLMYGKLVAVSKNLEEIFKNTRSDDV